MDANRKEYSDLQQQLVILDQQKDEISAQLENIEKDFNISNNLVKDLKKKILVADQIPRLVNNSKKNSISSKKKANRKEQLRYLDQMEKDLRISIDRSELMIKESNI